MADKYCIWQPDKDDCETWFTTCDKETTGEYSPTDMEYTYCPFCGDEIIEISAEAK